MCSCCRVLKVRTSFTDVLWGGNDKSRLAAPVGAAGGSVKTFKRGLHDGAPARGEAVAEVGGPDEQAVAESHHGHVKLRTRELEVRATQRPAQVALDGVGDALHVGLLEQLAGDPLSRGTG